MKKYCVRVTSIVLNILVILLGVAIGVVAVVFQLKALVSPSWYYICGFGVIPFAILGVVGAAATNRPTLIVYIMFMLVFTVTHMVVATIHLSFVLDSDYKTELFSSFTEKDLPRRVIKMMKKGECCGCARLGVKCFPYYQNRGLKDCCGKFSDDTWLMVVILCSLLLITVLIEILAIVFTGIVQSVDDEPPQGLPQSAVFYMAYGSPVLQVVPVQQDHMLVTQTYQEYQYGPVPPTPAQSPPMPPSPAQSPPMPPSPALPSPVPPAQPTGKMPMAPAQGESKSLSSKSGESSKTAGATPFPSPPSTTREKDGKLGKTGVANSFRAGKTDGSVRASPSSISGGVERGKMGQRKKVGGKVVPLSMRSGLEPGDGKLQVGP